ncbi:MAG: dihydropyrimidinase [Spirochaetales bacterium]|nr:dihydropyrimidinase [Spirochaetales bacterium]
MNILIKNGRLVSAEKIEDKEILIVGDKIKSAKDKFSASELPTNLDIIDARGKYVMPGIIDAHTHYHLVSRGTVTADRFYEGSILASFGGVTTIIDFSDHLPGKKIARGALYRNSEAQGEIAIDWALHQTITRADDDVRKELEELKDSGITTIKIFTTYKSAGYYLGKEPAKKIFEVCRDLGIMVSIHAEDDEIIEENSKQVLDKPYPPELIPVIRSSEAEYKAIKEYGELAGSLEMPIYIVHLSSTRGLDAVRKLKAAGVNVIVETTPHYLTLTNDLLKKDGAQKFLMTPPLRESADNEALWSGVVSGDISIIATDHCSFTEEQKFQSDDCRTIFPGIPGTEEMLQVVNTRGVEKGLFDICRLVSLLSTVPAQAFGLYPEKGSLEPGTDADIVIFNPNVKSVLRNDNRHTAAGYTPYDGMKVQGKAETVILRGEIILDNGEFIGRRGFGKFLKAGLPGAYME